MTTTHFRRTCGDLALIFFIFVFVLAGCDGGGATSVPAKPDPRPTSGPVERAGTTQEAPPPAPDKSKAAESSVPPKAE